MDAADKGASEQVERQAGATVRDGMQGANHSDSRSYREDLQRSTPPESVEACGAVTCSEAPKRSDGFKLDTTGLPFPILTGPPWQGIRYFCTTRHGGISEAPWDSFNLGTHVGDDARAVAQNRKRLAAALPTPPIWLNQVHGINVVQADVLQTGTAHPIEADALVTVRPQQVLAILTADCLPILMGDTRGRVLGLAHAGWRGLAAGVLEQTFFHLQARLPHTDAHLIWRAWIGPGISQPHFEVGKEVRDAFVQPDPHTAACFSAGKTADTWQANLPALAAHRLRRMGVTQIWQSQACTYANPDLFYSHRRAQKQQGQPCGRLASVAWKTGN